MTENKSVKEFYNQHWSKDYRDLKKDDFRDFEIEARSYVLNNLIKNFNNLKNRKLLEIGPGKGYSIVKFAELGLNVTAIDISETSLDLSMRLIRENNLSKKIKLINMDAHKLKFKSNTFDIIFIQTTLMHLNYLKVAEECKRVLKKNGLLIFLEPLNDNPLIFIYRKLFSKFKKTRPVYLKYQDLIKVSKYFNQFRLKGFYLISFLSLFLRDTSLYKPISKLFKRIETILMRVVPMLERYCWLNVSVYKK